MTNKKTCIKGHKYFKTGDCPVCPICEQESKQTTGFLAELSAPARRALESNGITTVRQLASCSKKEILALHGMGPASVPKLIKALSKAGLDFKK